MRLQNTTFSAVHTGLAALAIGAMVLTAGSVHAAEPKKAAAKSVVLKAVQTASATQAVSGKKAAPVRHVGTVNAVAAAQKFHPAHVMMRTKPGTSAAKIAALDAKAGVVKTLYRSKLVPGLRCVEVKSGNVQKAIAIYKKDAAVMYANPDFVVKATAQVTPYGITNVNAPQVWPTFSGTGVVVADLDTGVDLGHPDLPVPTATVSFVTDEAVQDGHGHGTHTAGTICALDNTIGVVGVSPQVSLIVGKVLSNGGSGYDSWVAAGIDWAVANNARVINMSLGGYDFSQGMLDSCNAALAANSLIIAAAGNDNSANLLYPAGYPSTLAVAAVDQNNNRASFSNFGSHVSLTAPGVAVLSTFPSGSVTWDGSGREGVPLAGSAEGSVTGNAVFCGIGNPEDFPPEVNGQVAHIRRGSISFIIKVNNALAAGATGVIISNNAAGLFSGTLNTNVSIPVVGISQSDGDVLQAASGTPTTVSTSGGHSYASLSGTSMATPHVAGVAALLAGMNNGAATALQIRQAMEETATDLGQTGHDEQFGNGLVNAMAAMNRLHCILCPADFNCDGSANMLDYPDFTTAFFADSSNADFNRDGSIDLFDYLDFVQALSAGC